MRRKKSVAMLIAISMLVSNVPIVMAKEEAVKIPSISIYTHKEIIGKDRYETGRKVLEESKRYKNIIVVNGSEEKLVDGLCASGLVEKLNATILPINPKKVDKKSMEYINKAENVYIIGENQAIPYSFEKSINKKVKVVRIGGKDRYETSEKIAKYIGSYDKAYLVNGAIGHPDAMSISSVAAKEKSPIILTKKDSSKAEKKKGVEYTAIGGTSVISNSLVSKYSAKRIGGETRYETNRMVLNEYYPNSSVRYFTNGETLVDALSAASISKNNGITFINRHKNHDLLEDIDTVQVGGFPYDVVFVNKGTGTGGSGGTVVPPSKPDIPEKPNPPEDSENHDPTPPDVKAIVEYDNFDKDKREYPLDIKIIKESIDPDKKDTITYECRYKDDNGKYVIKKLEKDENGYYPIGHRKAGHYEVDVRATDGHGGESAWIHVEFNPNVAPTKPEISVTPTDAKDFEEDKYVYDEYGDKVIKYPILLGIKKPSTDQDNDKITYEYKEVLNDGTEVTVSKNMYYSVGTHTVKVVDYDTHGGKAESDTVTFTIPKPNTDPSNQSPTPPKIKAEVGGYSKKQDGYKVMFLLEKDGESIDTDGDEVSYEYKSLDGTLKPISEVGYYPIGKHRVIVRANDGKGGVSYAYVEFEIKDSISPEQNIAPTAPSVEFEFGEYNKGKDSRLVKIVAKDSVDPDGDNDKITYEYEEVISDNEIKSRKEEEYYKIGKHNIRVRAKDADGEVSRWVEKDLEVDAVKEENKSTLIEGSKFRDKITKIKGFNENVTKIRFIKAENENKDDIKDPIYLDDKKEIKGYIVNDELIISSDNIICANANSRDMFTHLLNITSIEFSNFDTSSVTDMSSMFYSLPQLSSLDVSNFDTSSVTDMSSMFYSLPKLSSLDVSNFDTSNVTNMKYMFGNCDALSSLDVSNFNTSNVINMHGMFFFTEALSNLDLSNFNTSSVEDMSYMFYYSKNLSSLDVSGFDTSRVKNMSNMFGGCFVLSSLDLSNFNTSSVEDMSYMFYYSKNLSSLDVSGFDTSRVKNMSNMFGECFALSSLDLSNFNTSSVEDMSSMFYRCKNLSSIDIRVFDTSSVTNMYTMFSYCEALSTIDLRGLDTSKVKDMRLMFAGCKNLNSVYLDAIKGNNEEGLKVTNMFNSCENLKSINLDAFNNSNVTDMQQMFYNCNSLVNIDLSNKNFPRLETMQGMFWECERLENINLENMHAPVLKKMNSIFYKCKNLRNINLNNLSIENIDDMSGMFSQCSSLNIVDLSKTKISEEIGMSYMFSGCSSLTSINLNCDKKIKSKNEMTNMFSGCSNLINIDLSSFDTSGVTKMDYMFSGCSNLRNIDLSSFDTSKVWDMSYMFSNCVLLTSIKGIDKFDTTNLGVASYMFEKCNNLSATFTIKSSTPMKEHNYSGMLLYCSTADGSQFKLNYSPNNEDFVNKIVESYSKYGNIIKGEEV